MKILNFGSLNIDYTYDVEHFVRGGETLSSLKLQTYTGGKGLNQSVAAGRSGAPVWHAGSIGASDGEVLVELMEKAGVHTEYVKRVSGSSGHAIIQRDPDGQNCILLYGGANQTVNAEQAKEVLRHFDSGDWLILQNEISAVADIMELAHERGMKIALNPSPMNEKIPGYPLEYVDLLILNEVEAAALCSDAETDGTRMLESLREKFPSCTLVLTLGKAGAWYWAGEKRFFQSAFQVDAVDTTGAGDTFTGFLLGALARGETAEQAMLEAAAASAIAVTRPGAAPAIPVFSEVEEFLHSKSAN